MKERRRHPRLTIMGMITVILPGESRSREAYLANVSRGGIGIYLHKEVRQGQKITLTLRPKGQEEEQHIQTQVMWTGPVGDLYMAGLQFEKMPKEKYEAVLKSLFVLEQLK
jgi:Tfp pilus assembly protein PilZ